MIRCPLCSRDFDEQESRSLCTGCGKSGCGLVKCPNCGYEFPPDKQHPNTPGVFSTLKKIFKRSR